MLDFELNRGHRRKIVACRNVENTETKRYIFWPLFFAGASAVFNVASVIQQGQQASQQAAFNAKIAARNAQIEKDRAKFAESRKREQSAKLLSSQRAAFAKSGVETAGTPGLVIAETAALEELDALAIRHGGKISAQSQDIRGQQARLEGKQARSATALDVGTTILTSGRKIKNVIEDR